MKIKIIELLNRIANGEELPKKIKYKNLTFIKRNSGDYMSKSNIYITEFLVEAPNLKSLLNDEVEIIEEDKTIKELQFDSEEKYIKTITGTTNKMRNIDVTLATKINELVKEIKKIKENK